MERKLITFDSFIRGSIAIAGIVILFLLVNRLSGVLLPFFIAWIIAYMIYPIVTFFQYKLHFKNRMLSIFCTLILVIAILSGVIYLIVPPMIEEVTKFDKLMEYYIQKGFMTKGSVPSLISQFIQSNFDIATVQKFLHSDTLSNLVKEGIPKLWKLLSDSISYIFSIIASIIILLYLIFILKDYEIMADGWEKLLPEKYRGIITGIVSDVKIGMNQYFRGQALVALCVGILFSIGFTIIDFPLAIGLGLLIGALNMIPYLHALGLIPAVLLSILKAADTGQNFWIILASAFSVFVVVQIIEDGIIVPKIMGKITGLNPAVILLSLSIWGSLMGILGMIIALPMTTIMLSYYKRYILKQTDLKPDIAEKK
jgi:predicted PurR-regulated permease PerM